MVVVPVVEPVVVSVVVDSVPLVVEDVLRVVVPVALPLVPVVEGDAPGPTVSVVVPSVGTALVTSSPLKPYSLHAERIERIERNTKWVVVVRMGHATIRPPGRPTQTAVDGRLAPTD
jgi:hypothetical protein